MRGRKLSFQVILTPEERSNLERRCRMTTLPVGMWKRCQAILLLDAKLSEKEVSKRSGLGIRIVRKWGRRFELERIAGLQDRKRPGRKPVFLPLR